VLPDHQSSFAEVLAALSDDPELREFSHPDSALLVWDLDGARLLWASPAAAGLRERLGAAADGRLDPSCPARAQLRALGQGLAPAQGVRFERLRLDRSRLTPPATCICRRITLPSGEGVLLTAIVGPAPKPTPAGAAKPTAPEPAATESASLQHEAGEELDHAAEQPAHGPPRLGTVRFLWHTDAAGRFTFRSDALADVVGVPGAAIVGRTWDEIAGELVLDHDGAVSAAFARGRTWSGLSVPWRVAGTDSAVAVDLAGAPVYGRDQAFQGYRGFGLCRTDTVSEWPREMPLHAPASKLAPAAPLRPTQPSYDTGPATLMAGGRTGAAVVAPAPREVRPAEPQPFPHLSEGERVAFREIARALGARFDDGDAPADPARPRARIVHAFAGEPAHPQARAILDGLPIGLLVCRGEAPLFANRFLLDLSGYASVDALAGEGGVARLFPGRSPTRFDEAGPPLILSTLRGGSLPVDVRLATLPWEDLPATAMLVRPLAEEDPAQRLRALELDLRAGEARLRELSSVLDTATDGIVMLDERGRILSLNRSAEALFGYDQREVAGESVTVLLAAESHAAARDYLESLQGSGMTSLLNDGREVLGRVRQGGTIPLFMTVCRTGDERKFCAVLRDVTALKKAEAELFAAKRAAEEAKAGTSDLLAKVSHEVRTPLNAIIGFAEVMLEERFGRLGNERYRDYLKDIHEAGRRVLGVIGDLLDLAKIEAGRMELSFAGISLNEVVGACVSALSQQAARERIVVRTSFAAKLPSVIADERSVRQIVGNIVSNAVKFTQAGGQVIVSTAVTDQGEVVIRVRDTGIGMSDQEVEAALEPLRQLATTPKGSGSGLGLPLTRALVDANRARLRITSAPGEGTLVEVVFPPTRVLAE
jgi:PAS domain S-box-containing protein